MKTSIKWTLLLLFSLFPTQSFTQSYVNTNATGAEDGTSWEDAYKTLHDALENHEGVGEIWVAAGTYLPEQPSLLNVEMQVFGIWQASKIYGGFNGTESTLEERQIELNPTILSGDLNGDDVENDFLNFRSDNVNTVVFAFENITSTSVLDGFIIEGGHANESYYSHDDNGAGLFSTGSPQIVNCTFRQNYATGYGAGAYFREADTDGAEVLNCRFENNRSTSGGGGMCCFPTDGSITVDNCTFDSNSTASSGGGLYSDDAQLTITDCIFIDNLASRQGGGICSVMNEGEAGNYTLNNRIQNCTFENNIAVFGGAMSTIGADFEMTSCTFENNEAKGSTVGEISRGGALLIRGYGNTVQLSDCLFSQNVSYEAAGAIGFQQSPGGATAPVGSGTFDNCVFEENEGQYGGAFSSISASFQMTNCNFSSNDAVYNDPEFSAPGGAMMITGLTEGVDASISKCTFENNSSEAGFHGIIYMESAAPNDSYLRIDNSLFRYHSDLVDDASVVQFFKTNGAVINCTLADNVATAIDVNDSGNVELQNNIISAGSYSSINARGALISDCFTSLGGNLFSDDTAVLIADPTDLQDSDPMFLGVTHQLSSSSPCIDAGMTDGEIPEFDLAGNARIQGSAIDMGVYESPFDASVNVSNVDKIEAGTSIEVYPNPLSEAGIIYIDNEWQGSIEIQVINILGQQVANFKVEKPSDKLQINFAANDLVSGTYQVIISNGHERLSTAFVKM